MSPLDERLVQADLESEKVFRNLKKQELASVIFGCTSNTMRESLAKQLFGLPGQHFTYVMNIEPGMTLFLYNYSERKLYGIFEAASKGRMNIDPYGWTTDGNKRTKYPAQVQVKIQCLVQPLHEHQFKSIIADNYHKGNKFWLELDHSQTAQLKSLFLSSYTNCRTIPLHNVVTADESENYIKELKPTTSRNDCGNSYNTKNEFSMTEDIPSGQQLHVPEVTSHYQSVVLSQAENKIEECSLEDPLKTSTSPFNALDNLEYTAPISFCPDKMDCIYLLGGFDGTHLLANFDAYYPSQGVLVPKCPMKTGRSYASVSSLEDRIFAIGGGNGQSWYNTVETYNCLTGQWTAQAAMRENRGCLASVVLDNKIFAIGGGNGTKCFSHVEMFDPLARGWITGRSLNRKRFSLAAVTLNGAIYATGGYDGTNYLRSVERLDPRDHSWRSLPNMNSKRGCHSMVVLNDKLYSLGGYDGENIINSTEVFDPRGGSWINADSLNKARGYAASVTLEGTIYVIGGADSDVSRDNGLIKTVERFKEGDGWKECSMSVGRCFLTAISG